jgi:hypothetical protein
MDCVSDKLQQERLGPEFEELLVEDPAITLMFWLFGCLELHPSSGCLWIVGFVAEYYLMSVIIATNQSSYLPPSTSPPMTIEAPPISVLQILQYWA